MKNVNKGEAQEMINNLLSQGFDKKQIADCMCDGDYLRSESICEELAETVYCLVTKC